jgi:hypothetical protein
MVFISEPMFAGKAANQVRRQLKRWRGAKQDLPDYGKKKKVSE